MQWSQGHNFIFSDHQNRMTDLRFGDHQTKWKRQWSHSQKDSYTNRKTDAMVAYRQNDRCNDHTYKMTDAIVTWTEWQMQLSHRQNDRCNGHTDRMTDAVVTRTVYIWQHAMITWTAFQMQWSHGQNDRCDDDTYRSIYCERNIFNELQYSMLCSGLRCTVEDYWTVYSTYHTVDVCLS